MANERLIRITPEYKLGDEVHIGEHIVQSSTFHSNARCDSADGKSPRLVVISWVDLQLESTVWGVSTTCQFACKTVFLKLCLSSFNPS
jgi:hypothetical protein